jgi:hypothetical protein
MSALTNTLRFHIARLIILGLTVCFLSGCAANRTTASLPHEGNSLRKFAFGPTPLPGWTQVTAAMTCSNPPGYGFEPGAHLKLTQGASGAAQAITSDKPFFFSVAFRKAITRSPSLWAIPKPPPKPPCPPNCAG